MKTYRKPMFKIPSVPSFKKRCEGFCFTFCISLFLAACLLPLNLFAEVGGRAGELFNYGAGARPISMGGAFTAISRDASSVYYNPSGLGMLARPNIQLMRSALFEEAYYDYMGYARNFKKLPGGWGLEFIQLKTGTVEGRDEYNNITSDFNYAETAFAVAGGIKGVYFPKLSMGASLKMLNRTLADSSDRHFSFDLGTQYGPLARGKLDLGLVMSNVVSFASGDTSDKLPFLIKAGAAYRIIGDIMLAAELNNDGEFKIGTEYAMSIGSMRLGFANSVVSFGIGTVFMKAYSLDIAVTRHPVLGMSNKISVGYQFGTGGKITKEDKPNILAKDYLKDASKALNEKQYSAFLDNMDKAMAMDHSIADGEWGEKYKRMAVVVEKMNLKYNTEKQKIFSRNSEQAGLAQTALIAYMDSQELKSMLYAHASAGADIKESAFEEFLTVMSNVTGIPVRKDEILPRLTLVKEKMRKADYDFQLMKFDLAARECEEILLLDEKNSLAWTRLGSAYFAIGDFKRARDAYTAALQIDPNNSSVVEFMRMQGWEKQP